FAAVHCFLVSLEARTDALRSHRVSALCSLFHIASVRSGRSAWREQLDKRHRRSAPRLRFAGSHVLPPQRRLCAALVVGDVAPAAAESGRAHLPHHLSGGEPDSGFGRVGPVPLTTMAGSVVVIVFMLAVGSALGFCRGVKITDQAQLSAALANYEPGARIVF